MAPAGGRPVPASFPLAAGGLQLLLPQSPQQRHALVPSALQPHSPAGADAKQQLKCNPTCRDSSTAPRASGPFHSSRSVLNEMLLTDEASQAKTVTVQAGSGGVGM